MNQSIVNIKCEQVFLIFKLIKWPTTMQAEINNIVLLRFYFIFFFEFKLTLLCDV